MDKLTFSVATGAVETTLFIQDSIPPHQGGFVPLKRKDGKWSGEKPIDPGEYGYILHIRGGAPHSEWTLSIQRGMKTPLTRKGKLDAIGNGGRIAKITLA
jgi:hypothetical protein